MPMPLNWPLLFSLPSFLQPFGKSLEDGVEYRHEEDREDGGRDHASEDRGSQGGPSCGACSSGKDQGQYAQVKSERGHKDRPETEFGSLSGGFRKRHPFGPGFSGKFHDQDRVLGGQGTRSTKPIWVKILTSICRM